MNMRNFAIAEGRLTRDPAIFANSDGSKKVMFTIAARRNFKNADGKNDSDFIQLEAFVSADKQTNGVYDLMHKGDLVGVHYTVRSSTYTDKDSGETKYAQTLLVQEVDLKESKATTDARAQATAVAAPAEA
jgi:single-stranded DNA-binding protein